MQTTIKDNHITAENSEPVDRDMLLREAKEIIHSLNDHQKRELFILVKSILGQTAPLK